MIQLDLHDLANGDIPEQSRPRSDDLLSGSSGCVFAIAGARTRRKTHRLRSLHNRYRSLLECDSRPLRRRSGLIFTKPLNMAAVAVAVLLIKHLTSYEVFVQRSRRGTGIDYWLGDDTVLPYTRKARLEVSGILTGTSADSSSSQCSAS